MVPSIQRRKRKGEKTLLVLVTVMIIVRCVFVEQYLDANVLVPSSPLEDFVPSATLPVEEPYPVIMTPYNGTGVDPFYNISSDGTNLWDNDPILPDWIKAYLNWHKWRRQTWNPNHWQDDRWMIMQCLADQDPNKCGGAADRLKPLPTLLRIAYEHHRMLLIRWTKPSLLETYLVPPQGGVDWRVPEWMAHVMANESNGRRFVPSKIIRKYAPTNLTLLRTRYQSNIAGKDIYNDARQRPADDEPTFEQVFAPLWRLFFRPSPMVEYLIQDFLQSKGLVPGQYVAAHLRALYAIDDRPLPIIQTWTRNAINCASQLRPGAPIFFASDSANATIMALEYSAQRQQQQQEQGGGGRVVIHIPNPNPPLHIDRDQDWAKRKPSDYYDTFVDLYLLALGGCVAYSKGGYGHWALLINGNLSCSISHESNRKGIPKNKCEWNGGSTKNLLTTTPKQDSHAIFLEPMA